MVNFKTSRAVTMDEGQGADNGVYVKEYLVETLRPLDEDKALSGHIHFFCFWRYDVETFIPHKFLTISV